MKTKILLAVILSMPFFIKAQITLTTQLPNSGMLLKDQLWNMVITNNSSGIVELKLQLDIRDILLGQSVINASAGKIVVGKGMNLITIKDLQPIFYNYVATDFSGSYLPCGSYLINYHLIQETIKGDEPVADEMIKMNVTPLSPPLLSTPIDNSGIVTVYPQFTWMPPTPVEMFNPIVYDITVVAIEEGQLPKEAMEFNRPVYINTNLPNLSETMPSGFEQLQQGKSYAWQVVARNGFSCASPTEIWIFTIEKKIEPKISSKDSYVLLNSFGEEAGIYHLNESSLNIKFYSFDKEHIAAIKLMSGDRKLLQEVNQKISYGDNFLSIKLNQHFKKGRIYKVELITATGNRRTALFSINDMEKSKK